MKGVFEMGTLIDISNMTDVIDSRDIIVRIEELESDTVKGCENCEYSQSSHRDGTIDHPYVEVDRPEDPEEWQELQVLRELAEDAAGYAPDWQYGKALIRDSYFTQYAQELAKDCGMLTDNWPGRCIDWDQATKELQQDYTCVDYDGVEYWIRS